MPDHYCRVCHQLLTIDTIYPSNHKKHDWICKTCDNDRRQLSRKRNNKPEYDPKDVAFKSVSASNYIKPLKPVDITYCQLCQAYDSTTNTCHFNPPPWPKVFKDDWCKRFAPIK